MFLEKRTDLPSEILNLFMPFISFLFILELETVEKNESMQKL